MSHMFDVLDQASAFNQPLSFDTSKVTGMAHMFRGANALSADIKLLIRCAWAGTFAFATNRGPGTDQNWGLGSCR